MVYSFSLLVKYMKMCCKTICSTQLLALVLFSNCPYIKYVSMLKVFLSLSYVIYFASPGVETTRRFLLEWLSYTFRYIPVGLLDVIPQRLNWRPPCYIGRDDLETLMASDSAADWVC